jgi:hypothetical protein
MPAHFRIKHLARLVTPEELRHLGSPLGLTHDEIRDDLEAILEFIPILCFLDDDLERTIAQAELLVRLERVLRLKAEMAAH